MNDSLELSENEIAYFQELVTIRFPVLELSLKKNLLDSYLHKLIFKESEIVNIVSCTKTPTCIQILDKYNIHWYIDFINEVIGPILFKISYLLARRLVSLRASKFLENSAVEITDIETLNKMALNIEYSVKEILQRNIHSKLEQQLTSKRKEPQTRKEFLETMEKTLFTDILQTTQSIVIIPMFMEIDEKDEGWQMIYVTPTIEIGTNTNISLH